MEIKVLKTTLASKNPSGTQCFEYLEGNIYDIYDGLAQVFLNEGWGELAQVKDGSQNETTLKFFYEQPVELTIDKDEDEKENKAIDKTIAKYENKAIDNLKNKGSIFERFKPKKIK